MTYRIGVEHHSHYQYLNVVYESFNEARITPLTTPWQLVLDSRVEVTPHAPAHRYVDYWGSVVHAFDIQEPHRDLTVVGRSVIETSIPPPPEETLGWPDLDSDRIRDDFAEFLAPTTQVPVDHRLSEHAAQLRARHDLVDVGPAAVNWVRDQLTYVPGTTGVHTSAIEAWDGGMGVCQDFAHLTLALLRTIGVPARYCSGYLHPDAEADVGHTTDGESHAWIEAWVGDWIGLDPTVDGSVSERHVLVARGRDYADVTPIKGIFHGGPTSRLDVSVRLTRLA